MYYYDDSYYNNDYLQHYGVKGMKWGVRKARIAAGFHKLAAKNYELNDRTYRKLGNKTMASMNRAAAKDSYKKAAAASAKAESMKAQINKAKADKKAAKKLAKDQKEWDENVRKNWTKAYNQAADYANEVLIPKINKKYAKYDFSDLSDPKIKAIHDKYTEEYNSQFQEIYQMKISEIFGERPN